MTMFCHIALYFLGLQFILFGVNGFFHFLPLPKTPEGIEKFVQAMDETRYLMPTIKVLELLAGAFCLIPGLQVLGLFLLAPIVFNVVALHLKFNFAKSWIILLQVLLPYLMGVCCFSEKIRLVIF